MSVTKRVGLLAGAVTLTLTSAGLAESSNDAGKNLEGRLNAAEQRIAELESADRNDTLTEARADEIKGLIYDVLADADTRASLMANGVSVSYDAGKGYTLSDGSGNSMRIGGYMQIRHVKNSQDHGPIDNDRNSFEVRRARVMFVGTVAEKWGYKLQLDFGDYTNDNLLDAYVTYDYGNGWKAKIGQFKAPVLKEQLMDASMQLAADRSLVHANYTSGRTQGVALAYQTDDGNWRFTVAYHDGAGTLNTPWAVEDTEWAFAGRAEFKWGEGDWNRYNDYTSPEGDANGTGGLVGIAVNYQQAEFGTGAGPSGAPNPPFPFNNMEVTSFTLTVDGQVEFGGAQVSGYFVYRNMDPNRGAEVDQYAAVIQGSYYFDPNWEGFVRYEWSDFDMTGTDDINLVTVGVNRYFIPGSHQIKWTTQFGYAFDEVDVAGLFDSAGTGWRDDGADDGQIVVISQLQLKF